MTRPVLWSESTRLPLFIKLNINDALVDDITTVIAELKTVAGFDRPSPEYEGPSGEIDPWGLQGNGQICREQSEIY